MLPVSSPSSAPFSALNHLRGSFRASDAPTEIWKQIFDFCSESSPEKIQTMMALKATDKQTNCAMNTYGVSTLPFHYRHITDLKDLTSGPLRLRCHGLDSPFLVYPSQTRDFEFHDCGGKVQTNRINCNVTRLVFNDSLFEFLALSSFPHMAHLDVRFEFKKRLSGGERTENEKDSGCTIDCSGWGNLEKLVLQSEGGEEEDEGIDKYSRTQQILMQRLRCLKEAHTFIIGDVLTSLGNITLQFRAKSSRMLDIRLNGYKGKLIYNREGKGKGPETLYDMDFTKQRTSEADDGQKVLNQLQVVFNSENPYRQYVVTCDGVVALFSSMKKAEDFCSAMGYKSTSIVGVLADKNYTNTNTGTTHTISQISPSLKR